MQTKRIAKVAAIRYPDAFDLSNIPFVATSRLDSRKVTRLDVDTTREVAETFNVEFDLDSFA